MDSRGRFLAFTVSLSWNDAIGALIDKYSPDTVNRDHAKGKTIYALIVTGILVAAAFLVGRYFPKVVEKAM